MFVDGVWKVGSRSVDTAGSREFSKFGKLGKVDGRPITDSRSTFDRDPHGVCWVRVFEETGQPPVIVMGELPQNTSTSVTNMAEYLAPELI